MTISSNGSPTKEAAPVQTTLLRDLGAAAAYVVFIGVLVIDGLFHVTCGSACKPYAHWTDALLPAVVLPFITATIAYRFMGGAGIVHRLLAGVGRASVIGSVTELERRRR
jgi:hypothetical protein